MALPRERAGGARRELGCELNVRRRLTPLGPTALPVNLKWQMCKKHETRIIHQQHASGTNADHVTPHEQGEMFSRHQAKCSMHPCIYSGAQAMRAE
jgi:hypothetical protein